MQLTGASFFLLAEPDSNERIILLLYDVVSTVTQMVEAAVQES